MDKTKKINWFPGHMKKATDEIKNQLKNVDVVIEILDARAIVSSSNPELINIINNKIHLKIALKSDLAIINNSSLDNDNLLIGTIKNKNFRNDVINKLYSLLKLKIDKYKAKGLLNPKFLIMVIGLPNIGKSSFINFLKQKNILKSANLPGVTKNQRIVEINKNFLLIDTPGVFIKNINDEITAYKLSIINCIKKDVLPITDVLEYGFNFIATNNKEALLNYYNIEQYNDFYNFYDQYGIRNNFILKNNKIDESKLNDKLFNDISLSLICKTNFD